jgi:hypothetical protein
LKANESAIAETEEYFGLSVEDQNALWKKKFVQVAQEATNEESLTKVTYFIVHVQKAGFVLLKRRGSFRRISFCVGVWDFASHLSSQRSGGFRPSGA